MALIKCPECNKEVSDKSAACIHCGFPIKEFLLQKTTELEMQILEQEKFKCKQCSFQNKVGEDYCENCGARITDYKNPEQVLGYKENEDISNIPHTVCPRCNHKNRAGIFTCKKCGYKYGINEYNVIVPEGYVDNDFEGVYRYTYFGEKQEVYCPRCNSSDCSHYQEQYVEPGKTKTSYSLNLNPLKPFTLINKKEKIIRKNKIVTDNKFICNSCGKIFD